MLTIAADIGAWILVVIEALLAVILASFILFGGRIRWSIQLYGPLRFLNKKEADDEQTKSEECGGVSYVKDAAWIEKSADRLSLGDQRATDFTPRERTGATSVSEQAEGLVELGKKRSDSLRDFDAYHDFVIDGDAASDIAQALLDTMDRVKILEQVAHAASNFLNSEYVGANDIDWLRGAVKAWEAMQGESV